MTGMRVSNLRKVYAGTVALDGVDLVVEPGTLHCLVGPNGSGKSTLFRAILGLTRPSAGSVDTPDATVGCAFQRPNVYPTLTVSENLDVFERLADAPSPEWRETVVSELRLDRVRHRPAAELSGGFAKKLDLALGMLKQPEYLLLDEPLASLDDVSKRQLIDLVAAYRDDGNAVLVSTHDLGDFEAEFDRLTVLHDGEVVLDEPRDAVDLDHADSYHEFYVDLVLEHERS